MKRLSHVVIVLILLVCLVPAGAYAATHNVAVVNFAFSPQTLTINAGDTVTWTNSSGTFHTTTSGTNCIGSGMWDSGLSGSGGTFSRTFATPGTFPYFCIPHCGFGMVGTVVVNAVSSGLPAPVGLQAFLYQPVAVPSPSESASAAMPIGLGDLAGGGDLLTLQVQAAASAVPLDHYLAIIWSVQPDEVILIRQDGTVQTFPLDAVVQALTTGVPPAGFLPWRANQQAVVSQVIAANVPSASLGAGTFFLFYLEAVPGGLSNSYIWGTQVTVGVPMVVSLSGAQEVPAVSTQATATANLAVNFATGQILGSMDFSGLSSNATAAHIHQAAAGVNGPVILPLSGGEGAISGTWTISGTLTPDQLTALRNNELYLNIHSANFTGGEIRGQIIMPAISITTPLDGGQEVPPVNTQATGTGSFTVDVNTGAVSGSISFSGLSSNATAAHFHQAAAGVNGPVILPLSGGAGATSGTWTISGTLSAADLTALAANQLYLNVHSANFTGGEIRGQVFYPRGAPQP